MEKEITLQKMVDSIHIFTEDPVSVHGLKSLIELAYSKGYNEGLEHVSKMWEKSLRKDSYTPGAQMDF